MSPSPASKYRSKEKKVSKDLKESPRSSSKVGGASGCVFNALDPPTKSYASSLQANGRSRNPDCSEDCDSVSNNDTCSVESEDQKEKSTTRLIRQEPVPGADIDKRDKIRQKNEKKHQRQKERRAQDLQERCSGYLMSRKLEMLAQQLVSMGFSPERATMALMLNQGRVEESVTWLFEGRGGSEDSIDEEILNSTNLKIDISEELAQIEEMGINLKCSKQEVERVVVACEGDLSKSTEVLKSQNQKQSESAVQKTDEILTPSSFKLSSNLADSSGSMEGSQLQNIIQNDNDVGYSRISVTGVPQSSGSKHHQQSSRRIQSKMERMNSPVTPNPANRNWGSAVTSPSVYQTPPASSHGSGVISDRDVTHHNVENERNVRESVGLMQQFQSTESKQILSTSISPSSSKSSPGWQLKVSANQKNVRLLPQSSNTRNINPNSRSSAQFYQRLHDQPRQLVRGMDSVGMNSGSGFLGGGCVPTTLSAVSSLGLFSGPSSSIPPGLSPPSEWIDGGTSCSLDYNSIDWSLDGGLPLLNRDGSPFGNNNHIHNFVPGLGIRPASAMAHATWNVVANTEDFSMLGSRFVSPPQRVEEDSE